MPNDPNLPPGQSNGPFSRYLNAPLEGQLAEEVKPEPRPSGFMGTTGKLAYLGSALLKGLQQGKMAAYARKEQEVNAKFEADKRLVESVQGNPKVPEDVKQHAAILLGREYGEIGKEQLAQLKKEGGKGGKQGPAAHIIGMLGHVFDTLGGPTPAMHGLEGRSDPNDPKSPPAREQLHQLIAQTAHVDDPQFNLDARYDQKKSQLDKLLSGKHKDSTWDQIVADQEARGLIGDLYRTNKDRAHVETQLLQEGRRIKTPAEEQVIWENERRKKQQAETPSPDRPQGQVIPGIVGVTGPSRAEAPVAPVRSTTASTKDGPVMVNPPEEPPFKPYNLGSTIGVVSSPEEEKEVLDRVSEYYKGETKYVKRTVEFEDPNGEKRLKVERSSGKYYPQFHLMIDDTGKRVDLDGGGWTRDTATGKDQRVTVDEDIGGGKSRKVSIDMDEHPEGYVYKKPQKDESVTRDTGHGVYKVKIDPSTGEDDPNVKPSFLHPSPKGGRGGARGGSGGGGVAGEKPLTPAQKRNTEGQVYSLYNKEQSAWRKRHEYGEAAQAEVGTEIIDPRTGAGRVVTEALKKQWKDLMEDAGKQAKDYQAERVFKQRQLGVEQPAPSQPTAEATTPQAPVSSVPAPPKAGEVRKGYRFKGGNPADRSNWEKVGG